MNTAQMILLVCVLGLAAGAGRLYAPAVKPGAAAPMGDRGDDLLHRGQMVAHAAGTEPAAHVHPEVGLRRSLSVRAWATARRLGASSSHRTGNRSTPLTPRRPTAQSLHTGADLVTDPAHVIE